MVVDAVICHWYTLVSREEVGPGGFGLAVHCLAASFYAEYGLLASPQPSRLYVELDVQTRIFYWMSLHMNVTKTVGMFCQTY